MLLKVTVDEIQYSSGRNQGKCCRLKWLGWIEVELKRCMDGIEFKL